MRVRRGPSVHYNIKHKLLETIAIEPMILVSSNTKIEKYCAVKNIIVDLKILPICTNLKFQGFNAHFEASLRNNSTPISCLTRILETRHQNL